MSERSFANRIASPDQKPFWEAGQFKQGLGRQETVSRKEILLPEIIDGCYVNQHGPYSFVEFEKADTVTRTGYSALEMKSHGCGISVLYMALSTLYQDEFTNAYPTVGTFAQEALSFHRNDYLDTAGNLIMKGTPVFNLKSGWYHDALMFAAREITGAHATRYEGAQDFETVIATVLQATHENSNALVVMSVKNEYWRLEHEPPSMMTHLVLVNGFKYGDKGEITQIRVTDPFALNNGKKLNQWIEVNDRVNKAFTGRFMVLLK